jgi:hypothetical protein
LESLTYLGAGAVVKRAHLQGGVDLSYIKLPAESNGDAGDKYTGLDRFGRVVDQRWIKSDLTHVVRFQHAYDRNSSKLYADNLVFPDQSELYHANGAAPNSAYDSYNRLIAWKRGTLNGAKDSIASPTNYQDWTLDKLGNWGQWNKDGVIEDRVHDAQNELTEREGVSLFFDENGNQTQDNVSGQKMKWDAWNRLREVRDSANQLLVSYTYDARNFRITETCSSASTSVYFTTGWQEIERRANGVPNDQYVWSPVYIDALICRDFDNDANSADLETRHYYQASDLFSVTAITDPSGAVVERYRYTPYGSATVQNPDGSDKTGQASVLSAFGNAYLFTGRRADRETVWQDGGGNWHPGLMCFRNRMCDIGQGRFVGRDPLGYSEALSLYRGFYVPNRTDPHGMLSIGSKLARDYFHRLLWNLTPTGWYDRGHCAVKGIEPHSTIFDDNNEMIAIQGIATRQSQYYKVVATDIAKDNKIPCESKEYVIKKASAKTRIGQFVVDVGADTLTKYLLGGAHDVLTEGVITLKCNEKREKVDIVAVDMKWEWHDEMDANSFIELYNRGGFSADAWTFGASVVEGLIGDLLFDKMLDMDFKFTVHWRHRDKVTTLPIDVPCEVGPRSLFGPSGVFYDPERWKSENEKSRK